MIILYYYYKYLLHKNLRIIEILEFELLNLAMVLILLLACIILNQPN